MFWSWMPTQFLPACDGPGFERADLRRLERLSSGPGVTHAGAFAMKLFLLPVAGATLALLLPTGTYPQDLSRSDLGSLVSRARQNSA